MQIKKNIVSLVKYIQYSTILYKWVYWPTPLYNGQGKGREEHQRTQSQLLGAFRQSSDVIRALPESPEKLRLRPT